jgi:hypothetical protein
VCATSRREKVSKRDHDFLRPRWSRRVTRFSQGRACPSGKAERDDHSIDIGVQGAVAVLDQSGALVEVHDMPTLQDGPAGRRAVNAPLLAALVFKSAGGGSLGFASDARNARTFAQAAIFWHSSAQALQASPGNYALD